MTRSNNDNNNQYRPTFLPIYNAYIQIKKQQKDPVQSLLLFSNCLSFLADLIMSGSVFHSMFPLNLSKFNPYFTVFILGSQVVKHVLGKKWAYLQGCLCGGIIGAEIRYT